MIPADRRNMVDLRYYKPSEDVIRTKDEFYEAMELSSSNETVSNSIEILAGKVIKFLLTRRGTDAFSPNYGGVALHHVQISEDYLPKLRLEMLDDLDRCKDFITNTSETQLSYTDTESDRLAMLNLLDLRYTARSRLDVFIEIVSTTGKHHVVAITENTES